MTEDDRFSVGDLVWAKMKGYPPWPARIIEPDPDVKTPKKKSHFVFFFGTNDHAWIEVTSLFEYEKNASKFAKNKTHAFKDAVMKMDEYKNTMALGGGSGLDMDMEIINSASRDLSHSAAAEQDEYDFQDGDDDDDVPDSVDRSFKSGVKRKHESVGRKSGGGGGGDDSDSESCVSVGSSDGGDPDPTAAATAPTSTSATTGTGGQDSFTPAPAKKKRRQQQQQQQLLHNGSAAERSVAAASKQHGFIDLPTGPAYVGIGEDDDEDLEEPTGGNTSTSTDNYNQMYLTKAGAAAAQAHAHASPEHTRKFKLGFIGIGLMGAGIAGNLLASGYSMFIWNRTKSKTKTLSSRGATVCQSPAEVIARADITFICLADPQALRDVMIAKSGIKESIDKTKSIVNFSTNDDSAAQFCDYHVRQKGGRYLEAPVWGSKAAAEGGTLIILASGNKELYNDVEPCFQMIGKDRQFLGSDVSKACKFKLVLNMITGTVMCSLAEGLNLADKLGLSVHKTISILNQGALGCPLVRTKGNSIADGSFPSSFLLKHQQKDLRLALMLAESVNAQTQVTATCNEIYKRAKTLGYSEQDMSAVYKAIT